MPSTLRLLVINSIVINKVNQVDPNKPDWSKYSGVLVYIAYICQYVNVNIQCDTSLTYYIS